MKYRLLGKTGVKVSELCLGTMTFGRETDEKESRRILDHFRSEGGNFIDTADVYSTGKSEEIIGSWLKDQNRDDLVIATKVRFGMSADQNDVGLSRKHIFAGIDASLKRLKTDYVDLYQIHTWDNCTDIEETLVSLDALVKAGKVRYTGASNLKAWQLQKAIEISRAKGLSVFCSLQPLYNLLERAIEFEILDVCRNEQIAVIPWSPLRGGWLSGKYFRGMKIPPDDSRVKVAEEKGWSESWSAYNNEHTWNVIDTLLDVAKITSKTAAQVAINWVLQNPVVTSPIIGARTIEQLKLNLGSCGWPLDAALLTRLNDASDLKFQYYPYCENYKMKYSRS
jgi:aryl-alcohol dehydrogenase-like predicted oxidoreductase